MRISATTTKKIPLACACLLILSVILTGCRSQSGSDSGTPALRLADVQEKVVTKDYSQYFGGVTGTFILLDTKQNQYQVYNEAESEKRASPCSTFKIPSSLIGLETGVLSDENTVVKWDGKRNDIESWNQDQTLSSAFSRSVVWYFQDVASRVGKEKMQDFLTKMDYGNADTSGGLTKFWLVSSLKISPVEQVVFLKRLLSGELAVSSRNVEILKKIAQVSNENGSVLYAKSGFAGSGLGWFVGWMEKAGNLYIFATKVEGKGINASSAPNITLSILKDQF